VFSQALVYNAHQAAVNAWAGEPERDPTVEGDTVAGVERLPRQILAEAYAGVLRDPDVSAGECLGFVALRALSIHRLEYRLHRASECFLGRATGYEVSTFALVDDPQLMHFV
jgi:hypothetical protein